MAKNADGIDTAGPAGPGSGELDLVDAPRPDANSKHQVGPSPSGPSADLPHTDGVSARQGGPTENPIGSAAADGHTTG